MGFSLGLLRVEIALRAETTIRYFILVLWSCRETFRSSKVSNLVLVCNREIEKRRGNFPDAIFGVNVQFF